MDHSEDLDIDIDGITTFKLILQNYDMGMDEIQLAITALRQQMQISCAEVTDFSICS